MKIKYLVICFLLLFHPLLFLINCSKEDWPVKLTRQNRIKVAHMAIEEYKIENDKYPKNLDEITDDEISDKKIRKYILYGKNDRYYFLISLGFDRKVGGTGAKNKDIIKIYPIRPDNTISSEIKKPKLAKKKVENLVVQSQKASFNIRSPVFESGKRLPKKYTEDGQGISPPLEWSNVPVKTEELIIIFETPDVEKKGTWVHWIIYGLEPGKNKLPEGISRKIHPPKVKGAKQGQNETGTIGYIGPAPPKSEGIHRYYFKIYAIDKKLNLKRKVNKEKIMKSMKGHILDTDQLMCSYNRQ